ncbi:EpsG family protein, partial [Escherichia coli]|nr:EpsG family protein [Escherichia coli]
LHKTKLSNVIYFAISILLIMFAAFRGDIDRDHQNYINIYGYILNGQLYLIEPTFYLFTYISKWIANDYYFLFIIYAFIGVLCKLFVINKYSYVPLLSLLVYYSNSFFLHEMTQIRVGVAVGLCFLSLSFLIRKNNLAYCLIVGLATLFHYSACLFFIFLISPKGVIKNKELLFYGIVLIAAYILYAFNIGLANIFSYIPIGFIKQKFIEYSDKTAGGLVIDVNVFSTLQIIRIICTIIIVYYVKRNTVPELTFILLRIYIISIIAWVLFFDIPAFAIRVSELLGFAEVILLPYLAKSFKPKIFGIIVFVLVCCVMYYINLYHNEMLLPYSLLGE